MKSILSIALLFGVCGLVAAEDKKAEKVEKVEAVGTWKCEYKIGDMKRESTLTITKDGDKFAGTMTWPDQKDAKLKDVKLKDGELTFSVVREFMDNKIDIEYKLKIDGDKIKGTGAADFNGTKQEFDIDAKREKKEDKKDK